MVRVQKIIAKNFKSFAKTVEIPMDKGFNCIIGPNGSGKSNVADSMCFVLGKSSAKSMRADKSANLIYNGGKHGSPSKQAEVSVVFDNNDDKFPIKGSTLKITRTVKASGASNYFINDDKRTRQQVVDLLRHAGVDPDGHNVILQGDIVRFMELKSDERRELIEEISGISIYEDKKDKSMKELDKVQDKLNEANIILTERKTHLDNLKSERDSAIKYKQLEDDLKRDEATLINQQIKKKQEQLATVETKLTHSQTELDKSNQKVGQAKQEIDLKKEEIKAINEEINKSGKVKQSELLVKIQSLKDGLLKDNNRIENCHSEIKRIESRTGQLKTTIKEIRGQISSLEEKKVGLDQERKKIQAEVDKINSEVQEFREKNKGSLETGNSESEFESLQSEFMEKNNRYQQVKSLLEQATFKIDNLSENADPEGLDKLESIIEELETTKTALNSILEDDSKLSQTLSQHRSTIAELNEQQARLRVRDATIKEFSSANIALNQITNQAGVFGTVSDLGEVDSKFSLALQVAASSRLNSVVVKDENVATRCINLLKQKKTGVLTFLPLNKIQSRDDNMGGLTKQTGVFDLAVNLVKFDPKFSSIFSYVFGSTLVVKDLSTAKKLGVGKARMVTLEGDLVEQSGAMIGGFRRVKQGSGFKEKEVASGLKDITGKLSELQKQFSLLEQRKIKNESEISSLREKKAGLESEHIILSSRYKNQESALQEISSLKEQKKSLGEEAGILEDYIEELNVKLEELKIKREKQRNRAPNALQKLDEIQSKKAEVIDRLSNIQGEIRSIETQLQSVLLPEEQNSQKIITELTNELTSFNEERDGLIEKVGNNKKELAEAETVQRSISKEFEGHFKQRDKLNKEIQDTELNVIRFQERTIAIEERINGIVVDKARIDSEIEGQKVAFEEYKEVKLKKGLSNEVLRGNISDAQRELQKMGNVNLKALEAYENIHEEYAELVEKSDQLKIEKEDVLGLISEIDGKKTSTFMKTYKEIASRFKTIYSELSTKSQATFQLEDEEKPLEAGIDITVKLAGSKILDVRSLSGGEKTMAALAFIFAIQEFAPASFYLLDEVDAALDKKNSELLSKLIAKYSDKAQYIVISHNDYIIGQAKNIYGVSMQDGISKVVSLKV